MYTLPLALLLSLNLLPAGALEVPSVLESLELGDGLPVALPAEIDEYEELTDENLRRRFRALFWTRRDPEPELFENPVREELFERARTADRRYGGRGGDRGITYILLGEPDHVDTSERYQRFRYESRQRSTQEIVFRDRAGDGTYAFADPDAARAILDRARVALVVSPAIGYDHEPRSLPAPDVAGVEWQELLAARDRYRRGDRQPDFPLHASFNFVRASRDRARAYLDVDLSGERIVRPQAGAGVERYVTLAGLVESADGGVRLPIRDLAVLHAPSDSAHIRVPLELQPGRYRVTLLAREPLLDLLSFVEEEVRIPDYDIDRVSSSSLIVGRVITAAEAALDFPLDFRAETAAVQPGRVGANESYMALVHVYGCSGPAAVRFVLDGRELEPEALMRSGRPGDETVAAILTGVGHQLEATILEPASGRGLMLVRDLAREGGPAPLASHRARLDDFAAAATPQGAVRLDSPAATDNPIAVTAASAAREGDGAVGFFVDGEMAGFMLRPPYQVPVRFSPAENRVEVVAVALSGIEMGVVERGAEDRVVLESRTPGLVVRTNLVPVYLSVEDPTGRRFVTGLAEQDFQLREDGRPESIGHFEADTLDPMAVAFLIDESWFMDPFLDTTRSALADFASKLRPVDRAMVVGFNRQVALRTDITSCKGCIVAGILGSHHQPPASADRSSAEPAGDGDRPENDEPTAIEADLGARRIDPASMETNPSGRLMDALEAAVFRLAGQTGRKIVVLASHGNDSGSRIGADRIAELARRYGVMIYAIGLNIHAPVTDEQMEKITTDPGATEKTLTAVGFGRFYQKRRSERHSIRDQWQARNSMPSTLEAMSGASGGRAYVLDLYGDAPADMSVALRALGNELAHQYFIGFYSSDTAGKGLREIDVTVPGKDFRVRGRSAYYPD